MHPNAEILRAIADEGLHPVLERLESRFENMGSDGTWFPCLRDTDKFNLANQLLAGYDDRHFAGSVVQFQLGERRVTINGVSLVDDRLTEVPVGVAAYLEDFLAPDLYVKIIRSERDNDKTVMTHINRGIVHRTPDGAAAFAMARLGPTSQ